MNIRVLFLSNHNACRSQMAEGLVNHFLGDRVLAFSAGTEATSIDPRVIAVMSEIGIDISGQCSKEVAEFAGESFDYVLTLLGDAREKCLLRGAITYCGPCGPACPHLEQTSHGVQRRYLYGFADPLKAAGDEEEIMTELRRVRDGIKTSLLRFLEKHGPKVPQGT